MFTRWACALIAIALFPLAALAQIAYVTNMTDNTISLIDTVTNKVVATDVIPAANGVRPEGVAVTPDGSKVLFTTTTASAGFVNVLDRATNTITSSISVGVNPESLAITPDGTTAYVTSENNVAKNLWVIDIATGKTMDKINVGIYPFQAVVTPNGSAVYVGNAASQNISAVETGTDTVSADIAVGKFPSGIAITPDGKQAYSVNSYDNTVSVIDIASNTVTQTIAVGAGPYLDQVTPSGNFVYVTNSKDNTVSVIDVATQTVSATIPVGQSPGGISFTPNGHAAYVANTLDNTISVINTGTLKVTATIPVGKNPQPVGNFIAPALPTPTPKPVFTPAAGTYTSAQSVKITDTVNGAVIYYTTDGTAPTSSSTEYSDPVSVLQTQTIKALAIAVGSKSAVASAHYAITVSKTATPVFEPVAGTYSSAQSVTITDATSGAEIYYTTNGATPTTKSTKYTVAIPVSKTETIKAIATATAHSQSAVASALYTIGKATATPAFSPVGGTYAQSQTVTITDATLGATIYYTTDNTTPTASSSKYAGPISVSSNETIKALATATGDANSAVATAAYTLTDPLEVLTATASGNGVVTVPVGSESAFVVEADNEGTTTLTSITLSTSTGTVTLPVTMTVCQTSPSTGQCLAAPAPTVTLPSIAPGATPTFSVFVSASGAIANDPTTNRIYVFFKNSGGTVDGSASVAVTTTN
jgi:YVTN family beta-propeller protein